MNAVLACQDLSVAYRDATGGSVQALDGVNLQLHQGDTLGVVGESGSGKSTLLRAMLGLTPPSGGVVLFDGKALNARTPKAVWKQLRRQVQPVWQDVSGALNPRLSVAQALAEAFTAGGRGDVAQAESAALLQQMGLDATLLTARPGQLSGGQRQRVVLARALAVGPSVLLCDEPTSALDVSIQAQVLGLLLDLGAQLGLTLVLVSHDLAVVAASCVRIMVMYQGRVVEQGPTPQVLAAPAHPYTAALVAASRFEGEAAAEQPGSGPRTGCCYAPHCVRVQQGCSRAPPPLAGLAGAHTTDRSARSVACYHPLAGG